MKQKHRNNTNEKGHCGECLGPVDIADLRPFTRICIPAGYDEQNNLNLQPLALKIKMYWFSTQEHLDFPWLLFSFTARNVCLIIIGICINCRLGSACAG